MIDLNILKEAISELMSENIEDAHTASGHGDDFLADMEAEVAADNEREAQTSEWEKLSSKERQVLLLITKALPKMGSNVPSFERMVQWAAQNVGADVGDWPTIDKAWDGDIKFDPKKAAAWVCGLAAQGGLYRGADEAGCPAGWNVKGLSPTATKPSSGSSGGTDWKDKLSDDDDKVINKMNSMLLNNEVVGSVGFDQLMIDAASKLGIDHTRLDYSGMGSVQKQEYKKNFMNSVKPKYRRYISESKKKKGFGEGEPPSGEIYKKREVVQEADLEASAAAETSGEQASAFGDASNKEAEARAALADKQGAAAEAEAAYADAVGKKKDALEKIAKSDELKGKAAEKAGEVADKKEELAKAYEELGKQEQELVKLAQDAAEQSQTASEEAAGAAEEEQKAAEELQKAMEEMGGEGENLSKAGEETGAAAEEFGGGLPEFGDALGTDADAAEEKREEDEAAAEEKDAEREAADEEAAAKAESEEEAPAEEEEEEAVEESLKVNTLKSLIREVIAEKKWGDGQAREKKVKQELSKAGVTADDLRGMVLNTVMAGEEERDMEMIKLLKDMLGSLQSIEYHTTPTKGASSQLAQTVAKGWVNENKIRNEFRSTVKTISEMRKVGMSMEADLYEGFMNWMSSRGKDAGARINNEIADEIADTKALMQKLSAAFEEKYGKQLADFDARPKTVDDTSRTGAQMQLDKIKKQMAEVPGHHN